MSTFRRLYFRQPKLTNRGINPVETENASSNVLTTAPKPSDCRLIVALRSFKFCVGNCALCWPESGGRWRHWNAPLKYEALTEPSKKGTIFLSRAKTVEGREERFWRLTEFPYFASFARCVALLLSIFREATVSRDGECILSLRILIPFEPARPFYFTRRSLFGWVNWSIESTLQPRESKMTEKIIKNAKKWPQNDIINVHFCNLGDLIRIYKQTSIA